jgi:hypothetical protein
MSTERPEFQRSGLHDHKQVGKELISPYNQISPNVEQVFWLRDFLPEFLWIDALVHKYGEDAAVRVFNDFLAAADSCNPHDKDILDGTVSAFRLIPDNRRNDFISHNLEQVDAAVVQPFHSVLCLYSDCPMAWLLPAKQASDRASAVDEVRSAVLRLLPGKDPHTALCRALPLNRFFAHDKIFISSDLAETIRAVEQYPHGDRWRAEAFARTTHNANILYRAKTDPNIFAWARCFWDSNLTVAPCLYE